jgi:hypothetical protein
MILRNVLIERARLNAYKLDRKVFGNEFEVFKLFKQSLTLRMNVSYERAKTAHLLS